MFACQQRRRLAYSGAVAPTWLTIIAWTYLLICFGSGAVIAYDIFVNGRRQPMGVMNAVFRSRQELARCSTLVTPVPRTGPDSEAPRYAAE
jgi:hypothetical protein